MTGVVEDGPGGEPNINVKSLRMRFENSKRSHDSQEGVIADKMRNVEIASKASESIKKFESLAKQEPGFKPSDSSDHSLSKSVSTKGSVRVGSLRHKFESLANRSLTADLFNVPGESDHAEDLDPSSKQASPEDNSESTSLQRSGNIIEASATEGEPEVLNGNIAVEAFEDVKNASADNEANTEEMSTFTVDTEDSIEEPALCLKEQIEKAQADEMRFAASESSLKQDAIEHDETSTPEAAENTITELNDIAGRPVADNNLSLRQPELIDNFSGASVVQGEASADSLPTALPAVSESHENHCAVAVSEDNGDAENTTQAQVQLKTEVNNRLEDPSELDAEHEQVPIEIERKQSHNPKPRGFFQRLFTCGASV